MNKFESKPSPPKLNVNQAIFCEENGFKLAVSIYKQNLCNSKQSCDVELFQSGDRQTAKQISLFYEMLPLI